MGRLFSNSLVYLTSKPDNYILKGSLLMIVVMRVVNPCLALFKLRSKKAISICFKIIGLMVYLTFLIVSQSVSIYLIVKKLPDKVPFNIKGISIIVIIFEFIIWDLIIQPLIIIIISKISPKC